MGLKTKAQYIESLRKLKPTVYMFGEKIENVVDNPRIRAGINATAATYELAEIEEHRDMMTTKSRFTGEAINRFTNPPQSIEDLVMRVKINRTLGGWVGTCFQRCTGLDCLGTLSHRHLRHRQKVRISLQRSIHRIFEVCSKERSRRECWGDGC